MAKYATSMDSLFGALADPTRRKVIGVLGCGPATVGELARSTSTMALPSFMKHVDVLERSELIHTSKSGRVRTCTLNRSRLGMIDSWLDEQRVIWERRTDRLERFVADEETS